MLAQPSQFPTGKGMASWSAILHPADMKRRGFEVDLLPAEINDFRSP
jgi:hypothetical protein